MAAFSYQHHPFLDAFLPNTNIKMSGFEEACFSYYPSGIAAHQISAGDKIPENMGFDNSRKIVAHEDQVGRIEKGELVRKCRNGVDLKGKQELDSSLVELGAADQVIQQSLMEKKRKNCNEYQLNSTQSEETKEGKRKKAKGYSSLKETEEEKLKADKKRQGKLCEEPPSGFIHVRARRGQATDSHSLAERVRREKISERMKLLQGLVPGCDKVTGKALMLDEIINYVQSLQNQVEFLSMKLACVNPMFYDFGFGFEDYMMNPEKSRSLTPPIPSLQQPSQTQLTAEYQQVVTFVNPPAIPTTNNYPLLDTSLSVLLDDQKPNAFSQDNGNLCWNVENQKQRFIDQDCFYKAGLFQ